MPLWPLSQATPSLNLTRASLIPWGAAAVLFHTSTFILSTYMRNKFIQRKWNTTTGVCGRVLKRLWGWGLSRNCIRRQKWCWCLLWCWKRKLNLWKHNYCWELSSVVYSYSKGTITFPDDIFYFTSAFPLPANKQTAEAARCVFPCSSPPV